MEDAPIDLEQVRRSIDAEVRARRAAGVYPPGFERELDALFAQFAPAEVTEDFDAALERAEETVAVDPVIPVASRNPGLLVLKKVVSKLIGWYHVWLVQQVTALGATLAHALRLLGGRVTALERMTGDQARVRAAGARVVPARDDAAWRDLVIGAIGDVSGRVVIAECGDGDLLAEVTDKGVDAYGVEPRSGLADVAAGRGLEVRLDEPAGHLEALDAGAVAGVVLRACTERSTPGESLALAELAVHATAPRGRIVVCSLTPDAWGTGATAVEADLAPGRPLRAATWRSVLEELGCVDVEHHEVAGGDAYVVVATRA
jgi:hypothetical protein